MDHWLSDYNTYTLHKPVRKRIPCNPYTGTYIDDVWEMGLTDLSSLSKCDKYKYLLKVTDIFPVYLERASKGPIATSITSDLNTLIQNIKPITIQPDKGIEFVNATIQQNFHTTHIPDIKGAIIEGFNKSLNNRMYKYFTKNNTYR